MASVDPLELNLAETMVAVVKDAVGLSPRVGIADGKFAAYVAAVVGAGAPRIVSSGEGGAFLADLPIADLPVSVEMRRRLRLFGLQSLGDLGRLPRTAVTAQFGAEGVRAWELAHGIDRALLIPSCAPTSVTERLAFPSPVDTLDALFAAAKALLGRALHRPESQGRAARGIRLRAHLEDGRVWERQALFREPLSSNSSAGVPGERMLVALKHKIESGAGALPAAFVEVELTLLDLGGESALQGNLFPSKRGRQIERVEQAARQLKSRYGKPVLSKVVEVEPWSRIPERRFALIDFDP